MTTEYQPSRRKKKRGFRLSLPSIIILVGLFLICLPLFLKGFRVYRLYQNFQSHLTTIETLQANGLSSITSADVTSLSSGLRADTAALVNEAEPLIPLTPYLGWLPRVGPLMPVAPELLRLADNGTVMLDELAQGLAPALDVLAANGDQSLLDAAPELLDVLAEAKPEIERSEPLYAAFEADLNIVLADPEVVEALPWSIRSQLPALEPLIPLGSQGLKLAQILPELAARDSRRVYLLVAQNEDELRPTGGFISGAGAIGIEDGKLQGMVVEDAYQVDDFLNKPYDFPPNPLYEFLTIELFLFRDANYWPDFPRSAEKLMELYTYGREVPLDGAIAIDQQFLFDLIELVEPIEVPELEATLTAQDAQTLIQQAWAQGDEEGDWRTTRKSFIGPMAAAILAKLETDFNSIDPIALLNLIEKNTATKSLQIYMKTPEEQEILREIGWDGHITPPNNTDFLLALDHNMGTNKVNPLISPEIEYSVTLNSDGTAQGTATSTYTHTGTDTGEICSPEQVTYVRGLEYIDLINLCYRNYYRLYVPSGSTLLASTNHSIPGDLMMSGSDWAGTSRQIQDPDLNLSIIDNFLLVPRGSSKKIQSVYSLPTVWQSNGDGTHTYELEVVRQAGHTPDLPLTVTVTLPPNMVYLDSIPTPSGLDRSVIQFKTVLDEDKTFQVSFQATP